MNSTPNIIFWFAPTSLIRCYKYIPTLFGSKKFLLLSSKASDFISEIYLIIYNYSFQNHNNNSPLSYTEKRNDECKSLIVSDSYPATVMKVLDSGRNKECIDFTIIKIFFFFKSIYTVISGKSFVQIFNIKSGFKCQIWHN